VGAARKEPSSKNNAENNPGLEQRSAKYAFRFPSAALEKAIFPGFYSRECMLGLDNIKCLSK
jgi:hypothetical protein